MDQHVEFWDRQWNDEGLRTKHDRNAPQEHARTPQKALTLQVLHGGLFWGHCAQAEAMK